jgi:hypothetical protein
VSELAFADNRRYDFEVIARAVVPESWGIEVGSRWENLTTALERNDSLIQPPTPINDDGWEYTMSVSDPPLITRETVIEYCDECGHKKVWLVTQINNGGVITQRRVAKRGYDTALLDGDCSYSQGIK